MNSVIFYLPGGDTLFLKREIDIKSLQERIFDFVSIAIGTSTRAILLANSGYLGEVLYKRLGIIDLNIEVHSNFRQYKLN